MGFGKGRRTIDGVLARGGGRERWWLGFFFGSLVGRYLDGGCLDGGCLDEWEM